ncbi:MAG: ATP-binding cassette domain-containing protein [Planctomycetota bacterium]|nr:ATP-binding cassette domain-containing protein [Planctomycetota bacterium]
MIPGSAAFELHGAGVVFSGRAALTEASLVVDPGEALALVGPSGAGKTTLLRLLNASQAPTSGSVCVDYERLDALSPEKLRAVRTRIGFVHQDLALIPNYRVLSNVIAGSLGRMGFVASVRTMLFPRRAAVERAAAILERVGIGEKLYQRTDSLSGGQRQRVALARALFQEPSALLLDEPVSSVDPARARDMVELVADISRERGITLVVSIHDIELARAYFPRLVGLRAGRVVFDGPTGSIAPRDLSALYSLEGLDRVEPARIP